MPLWILLVLVVGITAAMLWMLHPLHLLFRREFVISHVAIWLGLWLIWGFFAYYLYPDKELKDLTMLMGGIWTLGGGACFAVLYLGRRLKDVVEAAAKR